MKRVKFNSFSGDSKVKKASGFVTDFSTDNNFTTPAFVKLSHKEVFSLYRTSEWLNAVITRIVNDCVKVTPRVRIKDPEKRKKPTPKNDREMKEVRDFLRRPNPNKESFSDVRWKFILDMLMQGRGAMEKVNNKRGKLKELYSLTVNGLEIKQDGNGNLKKRRTYRLKPQRNTKDSKTRYFNINECIHSVFRPTADSSYGIKPVDVLCSAVASDILRSDYNGRFFINNGEASGILSVEGMNKQDFKRFREYWKTSYRGTNNAHKMAVVNTKMNYVRMSITNRDMEFTEFGKELRNKIMAVFQMQPFIMGIVDGTTGKLNSSEQVTAYKDGAVKPILTKESYLYTEEIIKDGFGYDEYEIVFDAVDLLDAKAQADVDAKNLENMTTTINEVRLARGQNTVPWGDTPVSMKPGGAQIDPKTGRLIPPNAQGEANNNNTSTNKPPKEPKKDIKTEVNECDIEHLKNINLLQIYKNLLLNVPESDEFVKCKQMLLMKHPKKRIKLKAMFNFTKCLVEDEEFLSDAKKKIDKLINNFKKVINEKEA